MTIINSAADRADQSLQLIAVSMSAMAVLFIFCVAEHFATGQLAALLDIAIKVLAVTVVCLVAFVSSRKFSGMTASQRRDYFSQDGFLQTAFKQALVKSWMFSFLVLCLLQALDQLVLGRLPEMPIQITLQAVLALMLLLLSISFFVLTRSSEDKESEYGDVE